MKERKVVLIGTGFVGMSTAYSLLNVGGVRELVLLDVNQEKAEGEAMDLQHGLPYASSHMNIYAGSYDDCKDAELVVITAGVARKEGQSRLDLTKINASIMKGIVEQVVASGFQGIFIVASNPVDVMSYVTRKVSGFPKERVIGSGTMLDTARLRYRMSEYFRISSHDMNVYVLGEHGDQSFVPWSLSNIGIQPLEKWLKETGGTMNQMNELYEQVKKDGQAIIHRKKATYYGVGMALAHLIHVIIDDERRVLSVSLSYKSEHQKEVYLSLPAVIGKQGIEETVRLKLQADEKEKLDASAKTLRSVIEEELQEIVEA